MKKINLLKFTFVLIAGALTFSGVTRATTTVRLLTGETVNYTLNGNENFTAGVLEISGDDTKIWILDRNLGATAAGTGCGNPEWDGSICPADDATYGYHFQRGNNYGFDPNSTPATGGQKQTPITYNPFYTDPVFRIGNANRLNDDSVVDLWGGSTSDYIDNLDRTNWKVDKATDRRGPCPEGFHVPSYGEFLKIKSMIDGYSNEIHSELLIPFAGNRSYSDAEVYDFGSDALLRSSSPHSSEAPESRLLILGVHRRMGMYSRHRANAYSIRCVYDSYETYTPTRNNPVTSSYIHQVGKTLSICDPSDSTKCITMMDRNLGAITDDINSTGSYGYYYQWGNNHGFESCYENNCTTFPGGESTGGQIDCGGYSPTTPLDDNVFRVGYADYCTLRNHNLRGGSGDSQPNNRGYDEDNNLAIDVENRQGPCPDGYHVPSAGEWSKVLEYRAANYTGAGNTLTLNSSNNLKNFSSNSTGASQFQGDFKIPFAGDRNYNDAKVHRVGVYANLWSSSPNGGSVSAHDFSLSPIVAFADYNYYRADGLSVRCFKDSYLEFSSSESGENIIQITLSEGQNTCTVHDYDLGTYTASTTPQSVESYGQEISCEFYENPGVKIIMSMENLVDGDKKIEAENFTGIITPSGDSLGNIWNLTGGSYNLSGSHEIYRKQNNKIGMWTGDLQIVGTIPGGKPSGTYTGALNIIIQMASIPESTPSRTPDPGNGRK